MSVAHLCTVLSIAAIAVGVNTPVIAQSDQADQERPQRIDTANQTTQRMPSSKNELQQVIVTAQKKEQRLQDVPIPVTALSASALAENDQTKLRDYFDNVPGFVVSPGPGLGDQQMLTIRGISSGAFGNPSVGVTIDDVPYGAFTREYAPDIDPSDLARIEVLRGPQGTLYGASSMGGLIKYVTVDPSTEAFGGRVEAGINGVQNGAELGYGFRGSVNVPLTGDLALRASAFTREDSGYIDNPVLGTNGVNEAHVSGGRLATLWRLSEMFTFKISALYQQTNAEGLAEVTRVPGLTDLQQNYIRNTGAYDKTIQAYAASLNGRVANVDLTSLTGYSVYDYHASNDYTSVYGPSAQKVFGVAGAPFFANGDQTKFSQEFRAHVPFAHTFDWLLGAFYTYEDTPAFETDAAEDTSTGAIVGDLLSAHIPITYTEYAAFTDLTTHFNDRFDLQVGARESHLEENAKATSESGALLPAPVTLPGIYSTANVFTYLITPEFRFSNDMMVYARAASGYRPGRANTFNPDPAVPRVSHPDTTHDYEIGAKADVLNHRLSLDVSIYYIDFKDIQISLLDPNNSIYYYTNGSNAKSEGVELALAAAPMPGLTLAGWISYDEAVLTDAFPANAGAYGTTGSRLPYSARFSGNVSGKQSIQISNDLTGFIGADMSYLSDRIGTFVATPNRAYYPAYAKLDLQAGVQLPRWTLNLYANNVTNRTGLIGGGPGDFPPYAYVYIQPRTIGVYAERTF